MTEEQKRTAIREFFDAPYPILHTRTLVVGGCVLFLGLLAGVTGDGCSGFVLAGLGVLGAIVLPLRPRTRSGGEPNEVRMVNLLGYPGARDRYRSRVPPDRIVAWLMEDIARIRDESRDLLGLDETTRDPLCVVGPLYFEEVDGIAPDALLRRRTSTGYLYSACKITVFHFAEASLGAYQCNFDMMENRITAEETAELFYRDVVSVRTSVQAVDQVLRSGEVLSRSWVFALTVASGDRVQIILDDPALGADQQIRTLGEEAAANIRAMVRQYKEVSSPEMLGT